ncbi:hypothetical protein RRG08_017971 [Elysia crispata]|uniref:Uncharacterized protein n=1 Tax=Elysia crispata TaxID=231223 RepID=A0AAE0ZEV9_9GAST|nr:hypothetical protein RRG08_017971 [Elysia crispata]
MYCDSLDYSRFSTYEKPNPLILQNSYAVQVSVIPKGVPMAMSCSYPLLIVQHRGSHGFQDTLETDGANDAA